MQIVDRLKKLEKFNRQITKISNFSDFICSRFTNASDIKISQLSRATFRRYANTILFFFSLNLI